MRRRRQKRRAASSRRASLAHRQARSSEPGLYLLANGRAARLDTADASERFHLSRRRRYDRLADQRSNSGGGENFGRRGACAGRRCNLETSRAIDPATRSIRARARAAHWGDCSSETPLPQPPPAAARRRSSRPSASWRLDILPAAPAIAETQARLALARQASRRRLAAPRRSDPSFCRRSSGWRRCWAIRRP